MSVGDNSPSPATGHPSSAGRWPATRRPMGLGLMLPISELSAYGGTASPSFQDMLELTRLADQIGFDIVWLPDHLLMRLESDANALRGVWEGWTTIAGLAAATERIHLGLLVTCTAFRNPGLIAKMAENLDEISGGRFILGLGAGWHQPEYDMFGYPFDHRVGRFDEALQVIHPLLREGEADVRGAYYQVRQAVNRPRGPSAAAGGPPILIGGGGPRVMRLAARYADAWNSDWQHDPANLARLLAALDEACDGVGRDPTTLVRTSGGNIALPGYLGRRPNPLTGGPDEIAAGIRSFRDLGIQHYVCGFDPCTPRSLEHVPAIIAALDHDR